MRQFFKIGFPFTGTKDFGLSFVIGASLVPNPAARISAFIIKQIALTPFLCNVNNDVTRESVDSVIASLKEKYVDRFVEIISIDHHIAEKRNPRCIEIYLYINFYGIIIDEIVYVAMGVEEDE